MASRHERTDPKPEPKPAHAPRVDPKPDKGKDAAAPGHNKDPETGHPAKPAKPEPPAPAHAPGKFGGTI